MGDLFPFRLYYSSVRVPKGFTASRDLGVCLWRVLSPVPFCQGRFTDSPTTFAGHRQFSSGFKRMMLTEHPVVWSRWPSSIGTTNFVCHAENDVATHAELFRELRLTLLWVCFQFGFDDVVPPLRAGRKVIVSPDLINQRIFNVEFLCNAGDALPSLLQLFQNQLLNCEDVAFVNLLLNEIRPPRGYNLFPTVNRTIRGSSAANVEESTLGLYAQSVNSSMVEAQESMLTAILRNGSNTVN